MTVEVNTIFEDLNSVLSHIDPAKLNETLGAVSTAFSGRGETFGRSLDRLQRVSGQVRAEPAHAEPRTADSPRRRYGIRRCRARPVVVIGNASRISQTLVEEQSDLDRFLVSAIGLADIGNDVVGGNRESLTNLMHLLVPTTDLTNEYHEALNCALTGMTNFAFKPPAPVPGVYDAGALVLGIDRYRYPQDLPKVAGTGGPQCEGQLPLVFNHYPPKVIADTGTDPTRYGNQGILLNSDALKQWLFGPIDGPPRNTVQWGQPG